MNDCIFCKIVNKEIPAAIIYEDDIFIGFLDINPRSKGHTLIIPKEHFERYDEVPEQIQEGLGKVLHSVSKQLIEKLNATGFNILSNNGESAGQVVKHVHFHILPRYGEKGHSLEAAFPIDEQAKEELQQTYNLLAPLQPVNHMKVTSKEVVHKEEKKEKGENTKNEKEIKSFEEDTYLMDQRDLLPDS